MLRRLQYASLSVLSIKKCNAQLLSCLFQATTTLYTNSKPLGPQHHLFLFLLLSSLLLSLLLIMYYSQLLILGFLPLLTFSLRYQLLVFPQYQPFQIRLQPPRLDFRFQAFSMFLSCFYCLFPFQSQQILVGNLSAQ